MKVVLGSLVALLGLGCVGHRPVYAEDCTFEYRGGAAVVVRPATTSDSGRRATTAGGLELFAHLGLPDGPPVPAAAISLSADTLSREVNASIRAATTDARGHAAWDSVPAGVYGLLVRRVGYEVLRGTVRVRAGVTDTVEISLRVMSGC